MIKVSKLINELKAAFPQLCIRRTVRRVCLPHYGYSRWARYVTVHDATRIKVDIGAADYLNKIEEAFSEAAE